MMAVKGSDQELIDSRANDVARIMRQSSVAGYGLDIVCGRVESESKAGMENSWRDGYKAGREDRASLVTRTRALWKAATQLTDARRDGLKRKAKALTRLLETEVDHIRALNIMDHIGEHDE